MNTPLTISLTQHTPAKPARPAPPTTREGSVLSTLNPDGSRRWLTPTPSPGRWWTRRRAVAYGLIALFTLLPHLRLNGHPPLLLDLATRRFHVLGTTFFPTDTLLLALILLVIFLAIFLFTALLGRVWCGWACPQTVYLEFVFRPLERLFEGEPGRPNRSWLATSGLGKVLKYVTYFLVACFLAHTFLAYFVRTEVLREWVTQSPFQHPGPFLVMATVTALMLFDFTFFREQVCLVACPYGRMQSTLLDRQSLIVSYDVKRGEPRGKAAPGGAPRGDCVDCGWCVRTCPTGIDIRNGLQMECVHCTQCIDACDAVMSKLRRPTGLIRYGSQAEMAGEPRRFLRPRTLVYPAILAVLFTAITLVLLHRGPANVRVLRARGPVYSTLPTGEIANSTIVKITNQADRSQTFTIAAFGAEGARAVCEESPVVLTSGEIRAVPVMLVAPPGAFEHGHLTVTVRVEGPDGYRFEHPYRMAGPGTTPRKEAP